MKKTFLVLFVALFTCMAVLSSCDIIMLLPFEEEENFGNQIIVAGNLDVGLYFKEANAAEFKEITGSTKDIFEKNIRLEPGLYTYTTFKVANEGDLTLKYHFCLNWIAGQRIVDGYDLADVIEVYIFDANRTIDQSSFSANSENCEGTLSAFLSSGVTTGELIPGESYEFILALYMRADAGSEYNKGQELGEIGVGLMATQAPDENDCFDDAYDENYDENITLPY